MAKTPIFTGSCTAIVTPFTDTGVDYAKYAVLIDFQYAGGTSAILWYDGEYVTRCSNTALPEGRTLPNAFVYKGGRSK